MNNKITASRLRQIIQEELVKALVETGDKPGDSGPLKIKGTSATARVDKALDASRSLGSAAENVKLNSPDAAASAIGSLINSTYPDIDDQILKSALTKLIAKTEKK